MSIVIKKPGILSTIQDLGRTGARSFGINPGGVMDVAATRIVNTILGNSDSDPVLELHFPAGEMQFDKDGSFAIGGADLGATLDGASLKNWSTVAARKGSVLAFTKKLSGNRAYIAVPGGFRADEWLGSSSTNLVVHAGGFAGRKLSAGDRLEYDGKTDFVHRRAGNSLVPRYSSRPTVRVLPGSEFEFMTSESEREFLNEAFLLTNDCDRMGYRLTGKPLRLSHDRAMISSAVCFGTIQLLPDGQLIVLMADHQTSGGYPRIGTVVPTDLPIVAQCGPGDRLHFEMVSIEEAERLAFRFETELNFLRVGCKLQTRC